MVLFLSNNSFISFSKLSFSNKEKSFSISFIFFVNFLFIKSFIGYFNNVPLFLFFNPSLCIPIISLFAIFMIGDPDDPDCVLQ